jgi:hypothetical protein
MTVPTLSIIDDFNRANENPATNWSVMTGIDPMRIVSNELTGGGVTWSGSSYNNLIFSDPCEIFVTNTFGIGSGGVQELNYLCKDASSGLQPSDGNRSGYRLYFNVDGVGTITLKRVTAGVDTTIGTWTVSGGVNNGDSVCVQTIQGVHTVYWKPAAGVWEPISGARVLDTTHKNGYSCLLTDGNGTATWDNFGGGNIAGNINPRISTRFGPF